MQLCPKCSSMPTWFDGKKSQYYCNRCGATYKARPAPLPPTATATVAPTSPTAMTGTTAPAGVDTVQVEVQRNCCCVETDP